MTCEHAPVIDRKAGVAESGSEEGQDLENPFNFTEAEFEETRKKVNN